MHHVDLDSPGADVTIGHAQCVATPTVDHPGWAHVVENGESLLSANATSLERALETIGDAAPRLTSLERITTAKRDLWPEFIPWLLWEYGLGEILGYISDPVRALREGIVWQRLRGTPQALRVAAGWCGLDLVIEEEIPGVHFAEFQLDPGRVLTESEVRTLLVVTKLSVPVRSRLARIHHGLDLRRLLLDVGRLMTRCCPRTAA